jgi:hypothetical protein
VSQVTDKLGLRRLQGTGMKPLDSATPYPAHAVARRIIFVVAWLLLGVVATQSQQEKVRKSVTVAGSDAIAISSALMAVKSQIEKKASISDYEVRVDTYSSEKVVQFLAVGLRSESLQSFAVRCDLSGKKVLRVIIQQ